jgi:cyclopropane-fatty-acyl-phospholipid synthase
MAGSRLGFERNEIQLHHVLATKTDENGVAEYPLRPAFAADASYPAAG